jgi:hypothetical protein
MTWQQFLEWKAYDQVQPLGDERGDWQAASVCAAFMTAITRKVFNPETFLLKFRDPDEAPPEPPKPAAPDWQRMKMIARMQTALANADEQKKNKRKRK